MKKSFLVLGLFLVMGFAFAAPVLNVQGRVLQSGNPVSNGTVTGYIYVDSGCTASSVNIPNPSDPVNSNGVFDLTFSSSNFSSSSSNLLASNTPYYLKLVYTVGTAPPQTLVLCQQFYPTQIQGGSAKPDLAEVQNLGVGMHDVTGQGYLDSYASSAVIDGQYNLFGTPNYTAWNWFRSPVYIYANTFIGLAVASYRYNLSVYGTIFANSPAGYNGLEVDNLGALSSSTITINDAVYAKKGLSVDGGDVRILSPNVLRTNTIQPEVGPSGSNNVTVEVSSTGKLQVKNGSTTYEVCLKNGNCEGNAGANDNRYVVKLSTYTNTQSVFGPFAVQNVFQVGTPTQSRNSTFYGDAIVDGDLITSSVWPASGNLTLGRTGNWDYPSLELVKAAGSTPRYIQLIGGIVALSDGGFLGLTLFTTLSSAQIRGRNTTNNDVPVSIMTGLSVGSASGLTVSPGPVAVNNIQAVGSGTTVTVNDGLSVTGTSTLVGGATVQSASGLTVSPGPVKTNLIQPASGATGTDVTVQVAAAGRLYVQNGSTKSEVCMKSGNCQSGGGGGSSNVEIKKCQVFYQGDGSWPEYIDCNIAPRTQNPNPTLKTMVENNPSTDCPSTYDFQYTCPDGPPGYMNCPVGSCFNYVIGNTKSDPKNDPAFFSEDAGECFMQVSRKMDPSSSCTPPLNCGFQTEIQSFLFPYSPVCDAGYSKVSCFVSPGSSGSSFFVDRDGWAKAGQYIKNIAMLRSVCAK